MHKEARDSQGRQSLLRVSMCSASTLRHGCCLLDRKEQVVVVVVVRQISYWITGIQ